MKQGDIICTLLLNGMRFVDGSIYNDCKDKVGTFDARGLAASDGIRMDYADISMVSPDLTSLNLYGKDGIIRLTTGEYSLTESEKREMPTDLDTVVKSMRFLYPDIEKCLFFEQVSGVEMIDMAILDEPARGIVPVDDSIVVHFLQDYQERLKNTNFVGRKTPGKDVFYDAISFFANPRGSNARNSFLEWVKSHEWDGIPRVRTWFKRTLGVTAPALADYAGAEDKYIGDTSEAWFVGAVMRQIKAIKHEIVPVFIGRQGINKGNVLRFTSGQDQWFRDTTESIDNIKVFMEGIKGSVIVELGEAVQLSGKDDLQSINKLKSFVSKTEDQYRLPYARKPIIIDRKFVLAATSNEDSVFHDTTGNRRFYPMYCDPEKVTLKLAIPGEIDGDWSVDRTIGQGEVEQLWAEAYQLMLKGSKPFIYGDSKELAEIMQSYASADDADVAEINRFLDVPANGYAFVGARVTQTQIISEHFGVRGYVPVQIKNSLKRWAQTAVLDCWERSSTKTINGESEYIRKYPSGGCEKFPILRKFKFIGKNPSTSPRYLENYAMFTATTDKMPDNAEISEKSVEEDEDSDCEKVIIHSKKQYERIMALVKAGLLKGTNFVYEKAEVKTPVKEPEKPIEEPKKPEKPIEEPKIMPEISENTYDEPFVLPETPKIDVAKALREYDEFMIESLYKSPSEHRTNALKELTPKQRAKIEYESPVSDFDIRDDAKKVPKAEPNVALNNIVDDISKVKQSSKPEWTRESDTPMVMQAADYTERMMMLNDVEGGLMELPLEEVPRLLSLYMQTHGFAYVEDGKLVIDCDGVVGNTGVSEVM